MDYTIFIDPFIKHFIENVNINWSDIFKLGLKEYLKSQTEKYTETYTFLHRHEKVKFNDVYFPLTIEYKDKRLKVENTSKILRQYQYLLLIGQAGSGKSMITKYIFLNCIKEKFKIPILIELRYLNENNKNINEFIIDKICKNRIKSEEKKVKSLMRNGDFVFILDGFDELYSNKKNKVLSGIETFIDNYRKNIFVMTTRPGAGAEYQQRFFNFNVNPLSKPETVGFVHKLVDNEEKKSNILNAIQKTDDDSYKFFLSNPLLLSMFIFTFNHYPELPKRKAEFYNNVFTTLYSEHDSITKNNFKREKLTSLQKEEFLKILSSFSFITYLNGEYYFSQDLLIKRLNSCIKSKHEILSNDLIEDLTVSLSILIKDGFEYYFPHRSLQEYFSAIFVSELPDSKKEQVYDTINQYNIERKTDNTFIFWDFCKDLDELNFTNYFLIKQLEDFVFMTNKNTLLKQIISIIKIFKIEVEVHAYFKKGVKGPTRINLFFSNLSSMPFYSIFKYLNIESSINWIPYFLNSDDITSLIKPYYEKKYSNKTPTKTYKIKENYNFYFDIDKLNLNPLFIVYTNVDLQKADDNSRGQFKRVKKGEYKTSIAKYCNTQSNKMQDIITNTINELKLQLVHKETDIDNLLKLI